MLKKRLMSVGLALAMAVGLCTPALATKTAEAQMEAQIEAEIQTMEDEIYAEVYRQLEAQGGLHMMDTYKEILEPDIRASVEAKYGVTSSPMSTQETRSYYAPYGGVISYTRTGLVQIQKAYLGKKATQELLDQKVPSDEPKNQVLYTDLLAIAIGAYTGGVPGAATATAQVIGDKIFGKLVVAYNSIPHQEIEAKKFAYTIATNDPITPAMYSVTLAWSDAPYMTVDMADVSRDFDVYVAEAPKN